MWLGAFVGHVALGYVCVKGMWLGVWVACVRGKWLGVVCGWVCGMCGVWLSV